MPAPWEGDVDLSVGAASLIVRRDAPDLALDGMRVFGEGWDAVVFETDDGLVLRFAKRRAEFTRFAREVDVLRLLRGRLPVEIPDVSRHGDGWLAYRKLAGNVPAQPTPSAAVARDLGRFLSALHAIPATEGEAVGVPICPRDPAVLRERAIRALPSVRRALDERAHGAVAAYFDREPPGPGPATALVHNDLHATHVLLTDGCVSGIIDWTDAAIGDPAADFVCLAQHGGETFVHDALGEYVGPVDPVFAERAVYYAACAALIDLEYGVETGQEAYVQWGKRTLEATGMPCD